MVPSSCANPLSISLHLLDDRAVGGRVQGGVPELVQTGSCRSSVITTFA